MTWSDPIVEEVRRIRDAHAARFNYDLDAIFLDIKEREKQSGLEFVDGVARQREAVESAPRIGLATLNATITSRPEAPAIEI